MLDRALDVGRATHDHRLRNGDPILRGERRQQALVMGGLYGVEVRERQRGESIELRPSLRDERERNVVRRNDDAVLTTADLLADGADKRLTSSRGRRNTERRPRISRHPCQALFM